MKKNTIIIASVGVASALAYFFFFRKNKSLEQKLAEVDPSSKSGGIGGDADSILDSANTDNASTSNDTRMEEAQYYLGLFDDQEKLWRSKVQTLKLTQNSGGFARYNKTILDSMNYQDIGGTPYYLGGSCPPTPLKDNFIYRFAPRNLTTYLAKLDEYNCKLRELGFRRVGKDWIESNQVLTLNK